MDKIRSIRTPTPPPEKSNFDAGMEFLDKRQISDALEELNANEFRPKSFNSSTNKSGKSDADVVIVKGKPRIQKVDSNDDPLFHQKVSFTLKERRKKVSKMLNYYFYLQVFGDDEKLMEQWIHKFYKERQKMFAASN